MRARTRCCTLENKGVRYADGFHGVVPNMGSIGPRYGYDQAAPYALKEQTCALLQRLRRPAEFRAAAKPIDIRAATWKRVDM